jgi:uncharacterized membrane protein YeaQ/YmgE (transglycosylase-associated protein family)
MLLPTVSVTMIGLIASLIAIGVRRSQPAQGLLLGVVGAWAGFIVGALIGVVIDIVARTGIYVALLGHLGAVVGTVLALTRFRTLNKL